MRTVTVQAGVTIDLGHQYDNYATEVVFPAAIIDPITDAFGSTGTFAIWYRRSGDSLGYPIGSPLVTFDSANDEVTWDIVESDTASPGTSHIQLRYIVDEVCVMSQIFAGNVADSVDTGEEVPEPMEQWADAIVSAGAGGQPVTVTNTSAMTDHTKIYLYMGSQSGYTSGHIYYWNGSAWADGGAYGGSSSGSGLTDDIKQALLDCFEHVAWTDEHGQDYVDALEAALYPPAELVSISAVYTQSGTVYDTDTLDSLRDDLVVTAHYDDSSSEVVTTYTLSGTLVGGTSTITVAYGGKTTTFTVNVYQPAELVSISAIYTQSGTVYDTDTLDSLKPDLDVTALYDDQTTATVTDYTLSGTLTVGTSTITVSYEGKTTTFTVTVTEYVDPRVLVKNWDLTSSLTDTVDGTVATLGAKSGVANPTQDSSGLHFNAATQYIFFGTYDTLAGKTVELDVASFSFAGNSAYHIRFFCLSSNIYTNSTVYGPLLYRSGQGWSGYFNYPSSRQWMPNWIDGTSSDVVNAINGKTVKMVFGSDGSTLDLYLDDVHIGTRTGMIVNSGTYFLVGGNTEDQSKGDQCYNMTLTGVRIYENESAA